jgi:hypothetical protein
MSITLELTAEEETRLRDAAAAEGKDIATYIRQRVFTAPNLPLDDLAFLRDAGAAATQDARHSLLRRGIGYVYRRDDGAIVRHLPDASEEIIPADETPVP